MVVLKSHWKLLIHFASYGMEGSHSSRREDYCPWFVFHELFEAETRIEAPNTQSSLIGSLLRKLIVHDADVKVVVCHTVVISFTKS